MQTVGYRRPMDAAPMTSNRLLSSSPAYSSRWQGRALAGEELHCTMDRYSVGLKEVLARHRPAASAPHAAAGSDQGRDTPG